jgi:hypothetical protein
MSREKDVPPGKRSPMSTKLAHGIRENMSNVKITITVKITTSNNMSALVPNSKIPYRAKWKILKKRKMTLTKRKKK